MKRFALLVLGFAALVAYAGTRAKDSTAGTLPSAVSDGVGIGDAIGCRVSVRVLDGGTINGGSLKLVYRDSAITTWVPSSSGFNCTLEANKMPDAGAPSAQVCPDFEPLARFGFVGVYSTGLVGADGGTPNGVGSDGGQNISPVTRIECWGPSIP